MLIVVLIICVLGSAPFYIYHQFNTEKPIASFHFAPVSQDLFNVYFYQGDMCEASEYRVRGEQVQVDASFLKWQSWATLLGAESLFRFDRLSGRFRSIDAQVNNSRTLIYLHPSVVFDPFLDAPLTAESNWLVSTQYGSSVYVDIDPSLVYTIYKTEDGMIAKSQSMVAHSDDSLVIDINPNCLGSDGVLEQTAKYLNALFASLLK